MTTDSTRDVTATPRRRAYMVGGMEGASPESAMRTMIGYLGAALMSLPDPEVDTPEFPLRAQWCTTELLRIPEIPGVEQVQPGGYTGYGDVPSYTAARELTVADFSHAVIFQEAFRQTYSFSRRLRQGLDMAAQMGTPAPLDIALFSFHKVGGAEHDAFAAAKAEQIMACQAVADHAGDKLVVQIETVAAVNMTASSEDPAGTAKQLAGLLATLPRLCPGVTFTAHICNGDWGHQAMTNPASAQPLVLLANEIAAQWPDGATLAGIHMPFAAGEQPPSGDVAWYEPLRQLDLPGSTFLAAGAAHESVTEDGLRKVLDMIETSARREVAVSPACGLGRRPSREQALNVLRKVASAAWDA
jgi:hypothetical protein